LSKSVYRVLITGGFGFIGGRLAVCLAEEGQTVILGSRKSRAPPSWLPESEVSKTLWEEEKGLRKICKGVDVVIHAAGMNSKDSATDPVAALSFNGLATARLVAAACKEGVKRFVYLSTAHVYMNVLVGRITERKCPTNLHPYATSHLAGEGAVLRAISEKALGGGVLRLSNGFGAPTHRKAQCWNLFVNDMCRQAVTHRTLKINSNGGKYYDFLPMTDLVRNVSRFANPYSREIGLKSACLLNIGYGKSFSLIKMAQLIQSRCRIVLGFSPDIVCDECSIERPLSYGSNFIKFRGSKDRKIYVEEIDRLLRFCGSEF